MQMYNLVHVPKTAGGSLKGCFIREKGKKGCGIEWVGINENCFDLYRSEPYERCILTHHLNYGMHHITDLLPNYLTCLRDPKERLISEFFYHHSHQIPGIYIPADKIKDEFENFIINAEHLNIYCYNFSDYHFITGSIPFEKDKADDKRYLFNRIWQRATTWNYMSDSLPLKKSDAEELYNKAIMNITNEFSLVGNFHKLDKFIMGMEELMAVKLKKPLYINKTHNKISLKDLSKNIVQIMDQKMHYDYMLYSKFS